MVQTDTQTPDNQLYLDDLVVGQRFTSRTHVVDATEIKSFARQFRFTSMRKRPSTRSSENLSRVAGTLRRSPCGFWLRPACHWRAVSLALAAKSAGPSRRDQAIPSP